MTNARAVERGKVSVAARTSSRESQFNEVSYIIQNAPTDSNRGGGVGFDMVLWSTDFNNVPCEWIDARITSVSITPTSKKRV